MDYLAEITHAIFALHGCRASHVETVPVTEVFRGETVWTGKVEVFDLTGHPKAKRCYAWGYPSDSDQTKLDVVAVLEIPPVDSPKMAVKVAVANYAKNSLG